VLAGDQAQLSPIAAGGMFAELQDRVPTAELSEVHRAQNQWEREAWAQLREGQAQRALAAYQAHDRLHVADTREQAAERMLADWAAARQENPELRAVMLTDASNAELDRINARAQDHRAQAGDLGADTAELPDRPYALAAGDEVIFTAPFNQPGAPRVENGTLASVTSVDGPSEIAVQTRGAFEREVHVDTAEFKDMRLAYAQHVYKAQGATVDRAFVLTGGWQADRERAYVALSRARERTDMYVSREDLGEQGMDTGAIERLGEAISESHAKQASITTPLAERDAAQERESEVGRVMREQEQRDRDRDLGHAIE
jgi:ATP-dependent exoDNAse (exonuclease V) alpha subunit